MNLIEVVKHYISQSETDFSILINGSWGSGKTYFVKNEIKDEIKKIQCYLSEDKNKNKNYELVYVSLYGVTDSEEIEKRLFLEINPALKSKVGRLSTSLLSKGFQYVGVAIDKSDQKDLMNIFGGIPKNKVLVFDDLERLEPNTLNEVFGFINSYTEHQKLKVIIVADEVQLQSNFPVYSKIKEKLVRFTYLYTPDIKHVFPSFIKKYKSNGYKEFLTSHTDFICELFRRSSYNNLRSLKFILDSFELIWKNSNDNTSLKNEYKGAIIQRLLFFFVTYSISLKKGASNEELISLRDLSVEIGSPTNIARIQSLAIESKETKGEGEKNKILDFKKTFNRTFLKSNQFDFEYFDFLALYIHSGDLDTKQLSISAQKVQTKYKRTGHLPEYVALRKLETPLKLKDEDFSGLINEILKYAKEGKYRMEIYPVIFQNILYWKESGIQNLPDKRIIVEGMKEGMGESLEHSEYVENLKFDELHVEIFAKDSKELIQEIKIHAEELNNKLRIKVFKNFSRKILSSLTDKDIETFCEHLSSDKFKHLPVFIHEYITPLDFLNRFLQLNNDSKFKIAQDFPLVITKVQHNSSFIEKERLFFVELEALMEIEMDKQKSNFQISTINLKNFLLVVKRINQSITDKLKTQGPTQIGVVNA